jgi:hypothetical protein
MPSDQSLNCRYQYAAYFVLTALALVFTVVLPFSPGDVFERFLCRT